jgi:hypothetical protein
MKHTKYLFLLGCALIVLSCSPDDEPELDALMNPSELSYTISQDPDYQNKVFFKSLTPGVVPFWDYVLGTTNKSVDTVILPFRGDYWIKYRAFGQGGSVVDSTMITIPELDETYFADPAWEKLTNGEFGRTWKLVAVKAGDAKSTTYNDWGDASWATADFGDSARFDLDKGFNFVRYTDGVPTKSTFSLDTNEQLPPPAYLSAPGKALIINGGNKMPANDPSNEMLPNLKNRFRIFKLSNDTLILGQGAFYTGDPAGSWTYWHWYIRTN